MFADVRRDFAGALFNALGAVIFATKVHKRNTSLKAPFWNLVYGWLWVRYRFGASKRNLRQGCLILKPRLGEDRAHSKYVLFQVG